jgi:hypothetical protein
MYSIALVSGRILVTVFLEIRTPNDGAGPPHPEKGGLKAPPQGDTDAQLNMIGALWERTSIASVDSPSDAWN